MKLEHSEKSVAQQGCSVTAPLVSRRKLIKTGLAGAPVLMALKSVPALAANCKEPSGFSASGNLSRNGTTPCSPKANGITYWQNYGPGSYDAFLDTAFAPPNMTPGLGSNTFRQVLAGGTAIQKKIAAAWLSAKVGGTPFTVAQIASMWQNGINGSGYQPTTGVTWNAIQVEAYLDYVLAP